MDLALQGPSGHRPGVVVKIRWLVAVRFYRDISGADRQEKQYLLAQREARASEARSGARRGDPETATTKRANRPKRYPTEAQ
jgi:hypothetical protein